jgi:hypothetical protein
VVKKGRSPLVDERRDPKTFIGTETHLQEFARTVKAGIIGIHNPPGPPKPMKGG